MIADLPGERWRAVPDFEGLYDVSDQGRIRSLPRRFEGKRRDGRPFYAVVKERLLKPYLRTGYPRVDLWREGQRTRFDIAVLVATTFAGDRPVRAIVIRERGQRNDVSLEFVRYGRRPECEPIKRSSNTRTSCEMNGRARLTEQQVHAILADVEASGPDLARRYGVNRSTINRIRSARNWRDLNAVRGCRPEAAPQSPPDAPAVPAAGVSAHEGRPSRHAADRPRGARGRKPETAHA